MRNSRKIFAAVAALALISGVTNSADAASTQNTRTAYIQHQQEFQNKLYNVYQKGVSAYQAKNYTAAVNYLSSVVKYERKAQIYTMLGDSYLQIHNPSAATKYLKLAANAGARDRTTLAGLGVAQMDMGNYKMAATYLYSALKYFSNDPEIAWNLGISYDKAGNPDGTLSAMKKLIAMQPSYNPESYLYAGIILNNKGDAKQGLACFEKGLKYFPNNGDLNFHVGDNLYALGDYEGSIPYLQKAVKINQTNLDAYWTLGMAYVQLDDLDSAQNICDIMGKIAPKDNRTIDLCKTVQQKVQQKILEQQMQQDQINQQMQDMQAATGDDSATETNNSAMQMVMS